MFRVRTQIQADDSKSIIKKNIDTVVLDSGVSLHPDLRRYIVGFKDFVNNRDYIYDDFGHGTHVCGIISGDGKLSNGRYKGIAEGNHLFVGKILDEKGEGKAINMLRALNWVENLCENYPIRVVNISIGVGNARNEGILLLIKEKMDFLWDMGVVLVVSVGNAGPRDCSASVLSKGDKCISVGCHDGDYYKNHPNRCELYSGRGCVDYGYKKTGPDVVAPGMEIISCNGFYKSGDNWNSAYCPKSGTSMATAIVSGAVVRLLQVHPEYNNIQVRNRIIKSADNLKVSFEKQGYGMVNIRKLLTEMV